MKKIYVKVAAIAAMGAMPCAAIAQEAKTDDGLSFSVGADVVSSYVWRGVHQGGGAHVQPALGLSYNGFSLGTWGSVDIGGFGCKEVDLSAGYSIAGLDIAVTDYWWAGEGAYSYFTYKKDAGSAHLFEASLGYSLPIASFPLHLSWATMFAGADYTFDDNGDDKRAFSTYIEASLPFTVKDVALEAALGIRPWESPAYALGNPPSYYSPDFAVVNLSLKATKEIKITDSFTLPLFGQLIFNPNAEDIFLVCGISF